MNEIAFYGILSRENRKGYNQCFQGFNVNVRKGGSRHSMRDGFPAREAPILKMARSARLVFASRME